MTTKKDLENLNNRISNLEKQVEAKDKQLNEQQKNYSKLVQIANDLQAQTVSQQTYINQIAQIPFNNLELNEDTPYLDENQINTNMSIMVKQKMGGLFTSLQQATNNVDNMSVFYSYLLILERAKYFMSCCQFDGSNEDLVELLYLGLYYGSMNGEVALTVDSNGCYLFYPTKKTYDKYGKLLQVEGQTFNYLNSDNFKEETVKLDGSKVAVFKFNNEGYGLWVLAWFYLKKVYKVLISIINQADMFNKKYMLRTNTGDITTNMNIRSQLARDIKSPGVLLFLRDNATLEPLDSVDPDINQMWEWLENFLNFNDFHLLNMRVKDLSAGEKERDIASQQTNHATQNDNKNQFVDYFIDKWVHEINNKFLTDITWHNRMIAKDDGVIDQSKTIHNLEGGDVERHE